MITENACGGGGTYAYFMLPNIGKIYLIYVFFWFVMTNMRQKKKKTICFQWKQNTGLLAEVSSFSAKSLLRVVVTLS